jgi:serine/threonine protein kinase
MPMLQTVLKQMLEGILSLHKLGITHTDLKPENILFKYSNTTSSENNGVKTYFLYLIIFYSEWPTCPDIKIIDLGGAVYDKDRHDGIVNTR